MVIYSETRVSVKAFPSAKKEYVEKVSNDTFKMYVKEPPLRNMANSRIREIIAEEYGVSLGKVHLVLGHRSPTKVFMVDTGVE